MPDTPGSDIQRHADAPGEVRVLQHNQRRRSLRLEPVFWTALERAAARRNIRVGQLVDDLATSASGRNLASYVRVFALLEAERAAAERVLDSGGEQAGLLLRTAPAPGLLLDAAARVLSLNRACMDWLGPGAPNIVGQRFNDAFRVRAATGFDVLWQGFRTGRRPIVRLQVLHVVPGRVTGAEATLARLDNQGEAAVAWLASRGSRPVPSAVDT